MRYINTVLGNINWEKGKRGFQPKISQAQEQELMYAWHSGRWKNNVAKIFLKEHYTYEPNRKTLYLLKKKLTGLWNNRKPDPEQEVDWSDLETIRAVSRIPSSDNELHLGLYSIWEHVQQKAYAQKLLPLPFTYRHIKWLAFIQIYHSDAIPEISDRHYIASQYNVREMVSDWVNGKFQREDLDKWLLYKPWTGPTNMDTYMQLVEDGTIPELKQNKFNSNALEVAKNLWTPGQENQTYQTLAPVFNLNSVDEIFRIANAPKYLLPSQRFNNEDTKIFVEYWIEKQNEILKSESSPF